MRYVMILVGDESKWSDPEVAEGLMDEINTWWQKWSEAGKIVAGGAELAPSSTGKTISPGPGGAPEVTDGPYLEIKEVVGGFLLLDTDDLDEAIAVASGWPGIAAVGDRVEVRPEMVR
ncbi:YciI family protein [Actinoplanes sp. NEAU-A12]|uniref:YciI family protein n=1 Tax=Actinoplanes sandaracinus TaxID=3045177 RepID=A0ABT6WNH2_9ACTN|nr:YciI family protein [Actinoplanes sandaracinus]MDI6101269.1 YciI family protein [Actinoplanes sandaracinus]